MRVRLLVDDRRPASRRFHLRWVEYIFLFAGLVALDYYIWVNVGAAMSQSYQSWAFDQRLHSHTPTLGGYIQDHLWWHKPEPATPPVTVESSESAPKRPHPAPQPRLKPLDVIGRVVIPRLHLDLMVREGTESNTLSRAVGHVPSTALPGQAGNVALAAHRDTMFRPLKDIRKGDIIKVETLYGTYEYSVDSTRIVTPKDVWVLKASAEPTLTLITCYPFYYVGSAPNRFIVRANQISGPSAAGQQEAELHVSRRVRPGS